MILANVFLSVAMFFNSMNIINFNNKFNKNQLSVEKNDVLLMKFNDVKIDLDNLSPKYFLNSEVREIKCRGIINKNVSKNFEDLYNEIKSNIKILEDDLKKIEENSQAFNSEYIFQRKNHIVTEIQSLNDNIEQLSSKEKRKLICYVYKNPEITKYDGILGFSVIYNDKENPFLIGTIVMPNYIGKLESFVTAKSLSLYKSQHKNVGEIIYAEPLSYFDRYFLNTVGFK